MKCATKRGEGEERRGEKKREKGLIKNLRTADTVASLKKVKTEMQSDMSESAQIKSIFDSLPAREVQNKSAQARRTFESEIVILHSFLPSWIF